MEVELKIHDPYIRYTYSLKRLMSFLNPTLFEDSGHVSRDGSWSGNPWTRWQDGKDVQVRLFFCSFCFLCEAKTVWRITFLFHPKRGGKICLTDHFKPLWARNVPKFGLAHLMALGVSVTSLFELFDSLYVLPTSHFSSLLFSSARTLACRGDPRPHC